MTELLRVLPMSVQDLVDEWFEHEPLKAAIAAGGVRDIRQGPRSGGTSFVLLHHLVGAPAGSVHARGWWRDGPDAFTVTAEALARKAGVAIRTGAYVTRITVRDDAVTGVVLANGDEINAPVVISTVDPARTMLGMIDPVWLDPEFLHAVRQIKMRGCTAFVMYALDAVPEVTGLPDPKAALASMVTLDTDNRGARAQLRCREIRARLGTPARRIHRSRHCAGRGSRPKASTRSSREPSTRRTRWPMEQPGTALARLHLPTA